MLRDRARFKTAGWLGNLPTRRVSLGVRTWRPGWALAAALGCAFDDGGLTSGSTALGGSSESGADATGATTMGSATMGPVETQGTVTGHGEGTGTADTTGGSDEHGSDELGSGSGTCAEPQWWDTAWTRRRFLAVAGPGLAAPLEGGVVMLRLDPDRIDYAATRPKAGDLRFVLDGMPLPFEVERWVPDGTSTLWLRVPQVPAERGPALELAMYYGNPLASASADAAATWAGDYVSVHHLEALADATGNGHDAGSPTPPTATDGQVGGAMLFDGADDYLVLGGEAAYDFTDAFTAEALVQVVAFDLEWQAILTKGDAAWRMHRQGTGRAVGFGTTVGTVDDSLSGVVPIDDADWHHLAVVFDGTTKRIYVDGVQDAEQALAGPLDTSDEVVMIGENSSMTGRMFDGRIDEVRISGIARGPEYFAWHARSLADEVVSFGDEQSCE